jgi:hypothetical protein
MHAAWPQLAEPLLGRKKGQARELLLTMLLTDCSIVFRVGIQYLFINARHGFD